MSLLRAMVEMLIAIAVMYVAFMLPFLVAQWWITHA